MWLGFHKRLAQPKQYPIVRKDSAKNSRDLLRKLSLEVLEGRLVPHASELHMAVLAPPDHDAYTNVIEYEAPGEFTGATTTSFATYSTLTNGMPVLNSLPNAPTAIFLDFDGGRTAWKTEAPYSEDADGTTFNTAEQRTIYEAWRQVSSYYAMFDINVTTVQPVSTIPKAWLMVGNTIIGGYSAVGVFPNGNTVAYSANNSGDARTRVSGIAHEIGHNFGLNHQSTYDLWGKEIREYATATDPLHGPIMGVDYSGQVHKFIMGHSEGSGPTALQDDLAVIASKIKVYQPNGGDGFRADDFGNTIATATALPTSGASRWDSGIIERLNDVDAFSFTSTGGVYAISAAPDAPSGVDLKLDIYSSSGVLLASADGANNVQQLTMNLPAGTYYALVSSHGNYGDLGRYFLSVSPLPAGWSSVDVGTAVTGYTVYDATTGTYSLVGTGVGVTGNTDGLQYAYQTLTGDGTIVARVANVDNTSSKAMAGITIRETTAGNAREVSIGITPSGEPKFLSRSSTGAGTSTTTGAVSTNTWLKLVRAGNTFTGYTSADGVTWTQFKTINLTMASQVTIGLFTASANNHTMNVGQFTNVRVTGNTTLATPTYNSLAAPKGLTVAPGLGSDLKLTWTGSTGATGYAVERSADGVTFTRIGVTTSTSYTDPNLAGSMRYFYRVSATNASGNSIPSVTVSGLNRPSAVTNLTITSPSTTQLVLDWRETTGETGYVISRSSDGGLTYTNIATVGTNVPSFTDSGLVSAKAYSYRVTPTSALGNGVISSEVTGAPRLPKVDPTLGGTTFNSVTVNWTDVSGAAGYRIERADRRPEEFKTLSTLPAGSTTFTDTTVAPGTTYFYRVYATTLLTQSMNGANLMAFTPLTPKLLISDALLTEGNSGTKTLTFTVTLDASHTSVVNVNYGTANGTATAGSDYAAASGTITFNPGETSKTLSVTINGDTTVEADETFTVNLSEVTGATIADAQGVGTITNDDTIVIVPNGGPGLKAEYFANKTLSGTPTVVRTDATVNNNWERGSPDAAIPTNSFSARWTGFVQATEAGDYKFATTSDDGVRLWVNDVLVINDWTNHGATTNTSLPITLSANEMVSIRLEYYEHIGPAVANLLWQRPGQSTKEVIPGTQLFRPATTGGPGLQAEYFANKTLSGTPAIVRTDATVNNNWGHGSPDGAIPADQFSARWTGFVQATEAGNYKFATSSDDGVRLWVNDILVIDNWTNHGATTNTSQPITLSANQMVSIRMEYYENAGSAVAKLLWQRPGQSTTEVIPGTQLFQLADQASEARSNSGTTALAATPSLYSKPAAACAKADTVRAISRALLGYESFDDELGW